MNEATTLVNKEEIDTQLEKNLTIDIHMSDGSTKKAKILLFFESDDGKKEYVTYTFEEKDKNGLVILYTSIIVTDEEGNKQLIDIESDEEWKQVKDFMKQMISLGREA